MADKKKKSCFIITPIGNERDPIRRHIDGIIDAVIKPVFEKDYNITVAHRVSTLGSINKQIIEAIYESDLVIANLTEINPNVMYELAIRHCVGNPAIVIAEEGTDLPFDINKERTIFYTNDAKGVLELQEHLEQCLLTLKDFHMPDSLIYDVLKDKLKSESVISKIETADDLDPMKYILNRLDQIEYSINRTSRTMSSKNRELMNISSDVTFTFALADKNPNQNIFDYLIDNWDSFLERYLPRAMNKLRFIGGSERENTLTIKVDILSNYISIDIDLLFAAIENFLIAGGFKVSQKEAFY